jgi:hypothetical protein
MKTAVRVLGLFLLTILLISCPLLQRDYSAQDSGDDLENPDVDLGVLEIDFSTGFAAVKTLSPAVTMDVDHYEVAGQHSEGLDEFSADVDFGNSLTQDGLVFGYWDITVNAINPEGFLIGDAITTVLITTGSTTSTQVTVTPVDGTGTLNLTVQWDKHLFREDGVTATVSPPIEGSDTLTFTEVKDPKLRIDTYPNEAVPAGYYLVTLQLNGDGQQVWSITEAVRILADQTTSATYTYAPN